MDLLEHENAKLRAFVEVYTKRITNKHIPCGILTLICMYRALSQTAYIFTINFCGGSSEIMEFSDLYNEEIHPINLYFASQNPFAYISKSGQYYLSQHQAHIVYDCHLPFKMKQRCKRKYQNTLCSDTLFNSNKWNLIFQIVTNEVASITAIHPQFYEPNADTTSVKYCGYNMKIPKWRHNKYADGTRVIYNKKQHRLYKMQNYNIYALDFKSQHDENENEESHKNHNWKVWKVADHEIKAGASLCMIDNDRFMAIINAYDKVSYLYSMNETKVSVQLADACENRWMDHSIYHDLYHKIITVGDISAEWYDLNKDRTMLIARFDSQYLHVKQVWY